MKISVSRVAFAGVALALLVLAANLAAADPRGLWQTPEGKSHVNIFACAKDTVCGEIVALQDPLNSDGSDKLDVNNEDETLRTRQIIGIRLVTDMKRKGNGVWTGGKIYNPEDGKTYSSNMREIDANTLKVKGCVLFLCKSQEWTRIE
ncbi:MAG: DUF2147 domain-containing protein [Rhodobacteraceae bacterium]|nr:DUF2147 domain-containing protein [Paracoccaceae bacterium]